MDAIGLLRDMHAAQKLRFKQILSSPDPKQAASLWADLQPVLTLHEHIEETLIFRPLMGQLPPETALGKWGVEHHQQVEEAQALIAQANAIEAGTPLWLYQIATIQDTLARHILEEELEVFPRVWQLLDAARRAQVGQQMQQMLTATPASSTWVGEPSPVTRTRSDQSTKPQPSRPGASRARSAA